MCTEVKDTKILQVFEILIVLVLGQILSVTVYSQAEKGKIKTLVVNFMKNADV